MIPRQISSSLPTLSWVPVHKHHKEDQRQKAVVAESNLYRKQAWACAKNVETAFAWVIQRLDNPESIPNTLYYVPVNV